MTLKFHFLRLFLCCKINIVFAVSNINLDQLTFAFSFQLIKLCNGMVETGKLFNTSTRSVRAALCTV